MPLNFGVAPGEQLRLKIALVFWVSGVREKIEQQYSGLCYFRRCKLAPLHPTSSSANRFEFGIGIGTNSKTRIAPKQHRMTIELAISMTGARSVTMKQTLADTSFVVSSTTSSKLESVRV